MSSLTESGRTVSCHDGYCADIGSDHS